MGYEERIINQIERNRAPDDYPIIKLTHEKALAVLGSTGVKEEDFIELYGSQNVNNDLKEVERLRKGFEYNNTDKTAEVLEAIVYENIELSDWLGPHAETTCTSDFDDYFNGVDIVTEFDDHTTSPSHLALAIDVTFSQKDTDNKFSRIYREIKKDNLAEIKYFESHGIKGSLRQVPRVILGIEPERVMELAGLWHNNKKRELGEHPVKHLFIEEIVTQLEAFSELADKLGSSKAVRSYKPTLSIMNQIKNQQSKQNQNMDELSRDRVYASIMNQLNILKNSN